MAEPSGNLLKYSLVGGSLTAATIFAGTYLLGGVSDAEAIDNLREIRPTLRFTASGTMTATATIVALMLTLLSFSKQTEDKMKGWHYERIRWIARFSAGTFIAALVLLMILNVPINNAEESFATVYNWVYYFMMAYAALLGGVMVTVILLLYEATQDIILVMHPNTDADFLFEGSDADSDEERDDQKEKAEDKVAESEATD